MPKYLISWDERHSKIVEGENEAEAIDNLNAGLGSDESAEIASGFETQKIEL